MTEPRQKYQCPVCEDKLTIHTQSIIKQDDGSLSIEIVLWCEWCNRSWEFFKDLESLQEFKEA